MELFLDFIDFPFKVELSVFEAGDGLLNKIKCYDCHSGFVDFIVKALEVFLSILGGVGFDWFVFGTSLHFIINLLYSSQWKNRFSYL